MITTNVIQRVFHLRYGGGTGTCFAIDVQNKQYLVTAKHVIDGFQNGNLIELYYNGNWETLSANIVGHHDYADVSVITVNQILARLPLVPDAGGITYGQDTYFLGFPYMIQDERGSKINRNFPMPLVKKATLSAIISDQVGSYLLLDGYNNPGFSGGPVVFKMQHTNEFKVAAIISGYKYVDEPTYQQNQQTPIIYRANTGIIIANNIDYALELIKINPIGVE
ncbi:MAG: serine protease [Candidatus Kapaibacterium sp.]